MIWKLERVFVSLGVAGRTEDVLVSLHAGHTSLEGSVVGLDRAPHGRTVWLEEVDDEL